MHKKLHILAILFCLVAFSSCDFNYVDYIQHIESPDKKFNYSLYSDAIGIGDPGFIVLKIDKGINPKAVDIKWNFSKGIDKKDSEWLDSHQILYNYEESSDYTSDPKIEIIKGKYLVFSRGGFYFGLYDVELDKPIFNDCCPWSNWASQNIGAEKGTDYKGKIPNDAKSDYGLWVKKYMHDEIREYIIKN